MSFFEIDEQVAKGLPVAEFKSERDLQTLVQSNLKILFGCRLVADEFSTGGRHMGRIDTLAIDEDNSPVIIEYKVVESSDLLNQSLFYLSWIDDHHADFELLVSKKYPDIEVDWNDVRVICLAPGYKRYDLHAVGKMGSNIELWKFQRHTKKFLELKKVFPLDSIPDHDGPTESTLRSGEKAAETRRYSEYDMQSHISKADESLRPIFDIIRNEIISLDASVQETPKKFYIAYKVSSNFACVEFHKKKITIFLKLNPKKIACLPENARDVSDIGHYGTGNLELEINGVDDAMAALPFIRQAFDESNMI